MTGATDAGEAQTLSGLETGRWTVMTETGSTYLLDLHAMTVTRSNDWHVLRRDDEELILWALLGCTLGQRALLIVEVLGESTVLTFRVTSTVVGIRRTPDTGA